METYGNEQFFDLTEVWFRDLFDQLEAPWDILRKDVKEAWIKGNLKPNVAQIKRSGHMVTEDTQIECDGGMATIDAGSYLRGNDIEVRAGVHIEAGSWVCGPTLLGQTTTVRHGAYVRGGVLTGNGAVIGHASEVKSSIFLNKAKAAHFAYVGDSILGNGVNLGAGTKVSNLKITNDEVVLRLDDRAVKTGLRKMGALIGDGTETGCNSVLSPGVLLGKGCMVYPAIAVRKNYYPKGTIIR